MSDPTDDPRPYALREKPPREFRMSPWMDAVDKIEADLRDLGELRVEQGEVREPNPAETYYAALEALLGVATLLKDYQKVKAELERLKSLDSYKEQVERIEMLNVLNANLNTELKDYRSNPLNVRVADLESQLAIARKANHYEALQAAERRISELENEILEIGELDNG